MRYKSLIFYCELTQVKCQQSKHTLNATEMENFVKRRKITPLVATPPINSDVSQQSTSSAISKHDASTESGNVISKKRKYQQKYKVEWEKERFWLTQIENEAFCKLCQKTLANDVFNLNRHEESSKHKQKIVLLEENPVKQRNIKECFNKIQPSQYKKIEQELGMVMYSIQNSLPFSIMNILPKLMGTLFGEEKTVLKCGKTKATEIVNSIIGPFAKLKIAEELKKKKFSLLIDEGTDIASKKCLVLIVRYIPDGKSYVSDTFFGLKEIDDGSAKTICDTIKNYLSLLDIPMKNLIGLATDNASVMRGEKAGVKTKLRDVNKNMFYLGCTCHSLNLCSSAASRELPLELEKLVRDIYSFFAHSSKRKKDFEEFQRAFDVESHQLLRLSNTRWLSLEVAVQRVLEQWEPLRHYFILMTFEELHESSASDIFNNLNNTNKAFFLFLSYILAEINKLNKLYQSRGTLIHLLYDHITVFFKNILQNFVKQEYIDLETDYHDTKLHLNLSQMYFGLQFQKFEESSCGDIDIFSIKCKLLKYYIKLCDETCKRFSFADKNLRLLRYFDPNCIQNGDMQTISPLLKTYPFFDGLEESLNSEWRTFIVFDKTRVKNLFQNNLVEGWTMLKKEKNYGDEFRFTELSEYMCNLAVLPHSTAGAERLFSVMNIIKSSKRNCLSVKSVENIIFAKELCDFENTYVPSKALVQFYLKFKFVEGKFVPRNM